VRDVVEFLAESVVEGVDRRRFLRRAAHGSFMALALISTGAGAQVLKTTLPQLVVMGDTCSGPGLGCPGASHGNPCGSSRCCNTTRDTTPNNCDCSVGVNTTTCKTNGSASSTTSPNCYGGDTRFYAARCWTCVGPCSGGTRWTTTCCDCKTNASVCHDPDFGSNRGRCIAYHQTSANCTP
jgi:hypothetical protein